MKPLLLFTVVSVFAIFVGSQITEGAILVPYWQSLSSTDFYIYYNQFGPLIGRFYTVLTIVSLLIPIALSAYCKLNNNKAYIPALISSFFAVLFIVIFYAYFKPTNGLFYQGAFTPMALERELVTWSYWHWGRVCVEILSLIFLILSASKILSVEEASVPSY